MLLAYFATDGDLLLANELEILGKGKPGSLPFQYPNEIG